MTLPDLSVTSDSVRCCSRPDKPFAKGDREGTRQDDDYSRLEQLRRHGSRIQVTAYRPDTERAGVRRFVPAGRKLFGIASEN